MASNYKVVVFKQAPDLNFWLKDRNIKTLNEIPKQKDELEKEHMYQKKIKWKKQE